MRTIKAQMLSLEKFHKYGSFQNLLDVRNQLNPHGEGKERGFASDLVPLPCAPGNAMQASVNIAAKDEGDVITFTEFHNYTSEGILPLDGDCIIHVGTAQGDVTPDKIEAFFLPRGTMAMIKPGVLHGTQIAHKEDLVHVLILLPERTYHNDCVVTRFDEPDQIKVEYEKSPCSI